MLDKKYTIDIIDNRIDDFQNLRNRTNQQIKMLENIISDIDEEIFLCENLKNKIEKTFQDRGENE